jgi:hypothetical protein
MYALFNAITKPGINLKEIEDNKLSGCDSKKENLKN